MASVGTDTTFDKILALQLAVAWAGEGRCSPPRLGWWSTDLIDEDGGGDLFARLLPRTHAWAALETTRGVARRVDSRARAKLAHPDRVRTLFFLGFELDEQLDDRLLLHKRAARPPGESLSLPLPLTADFAIERVAAALGHENARFTRVPGGRQMKGAVPSAPDELAALLAGGMVPFADEYPMPFYFLER